jgi:hypothetical protein
MCTTLKWVSKYDFIFGNEEFFFQKSPSFGLTIIDPKESEFDQKGSKNASTL